MIEIRNESGKICAKIENFRAENDVWALSVSWMCDADGLPSENVWNEATALGVKRCKDQGAAWIDSRVTVSGEGADEAWQAPRAAMHRTSLAALGFRQGEGRVEYRLSIDEALAALEARERPAQGRAQLAWSCIDPDSEHELAGAAGLYRQAAGDDGSPAQPACCSGEDALGFLRALLEDAEAVKAPERLQIGRCAGHPAVILALMVHPGSGWSTIAFLGAVPGFRGRGLGGQAMLHGIRCLKAMGGKIYHDGTGEHNEAACALLSHLGKPPFRRMEEWRLALQELRQPGI